MIIIITGVSGSGKTTVGSYLSKFLNLPFFDADDFHPQENIQKMKSGIPLTDKDREPWLLELASQIKNWNNKSGGILACSALKEAYRKTLNVTSDIHWIHLSVDESTIKKRFESRKEHFMNPALIGSQFATWEKPNDGFLVNANLPLAQVTEQILIHIKNNPLKAEIGIIGMGVMGKSLALNFAEKGMRVSVFNRFIPGKEEKIASSFAEEHVIFSNLMGFDDLNSFIDSLENQKIILLMILAGAAVDEMISQLLPFLREGDLIADAGNSFFEDSNLRHDALSKQGIHFVPLGVSGGEEGARKGPSLMPGGTAEAFQIMKPYLEKIAAKDSKNQACLVHAGEKGAGHFIKMIHNSIEYAEMQAIAEIHHLLRYGLKFKPEEISKIFKNWSTEGLKSYLLEITAEIVLAQSKEGYLLDEILDVAAQKGTGSWAINTSLKYQIPANPLSEAVFARILSAEKEERVKNAELYNHNFKAFIEDRNLWLEKFKNAYLLTRIINHEVGFSIISKVYEKENWTLNLSAIANAWTNGCIIRSELMEELVHIFQETSLLLTHQSIVTKIKKLKHDFASTIGMAIQHDFSIPVMSAAVNYLNAKISAQSSANLIQAQRDYFGAHTYQLTSDPTGTAKHTDWKKALKNQQPKK